MLKLRLIGALLLAGCFCLAGYLQPRQEAREASEGRSSSVLGLLLGDGRRMFANTFFAKADAYFHRGNYPSIYDAQPIREENHMSEEAGHGETGHEEDHEEGMGQPADWIERFGRHFYPTAHVHLRGEEEREMLPWLQLAAELDPHQVQTYVVTAYFLGWRLGKVDEAERFLYEGLRANPNDPELLNELGQLYFQKRDDLDRARNVWLATLRQWERVEKPKEKPNYLILERALSGLAGIAEKQGDLRLAIQYLQHVKQVSPLPEAVQQRIDELKARATPGAQE